MGRSPSAAWEQALGRWLEPFLERFSREAQRRWAPVYLKGLLLPGERKSVEPLAARVAPDDVQQLYHFVGGSPWPTEPLEDALGREADRNATVNKCHQDPENLQFCWSCRQNAWSFRCRNATRDIVSC